MKVNSITIIIGIVAGIFVLAVLGILVYLALGLGEDMPANPGGLIGGLTLLWASVRSKLLNFNVAMPQLGTVSTNGQTASEANSQTDPREAAAERARHEEERRREAEIQAEQARREEDGRRVEVRKMAEAQLAEVQSLDKFAFITPDTVMRAMEAKDYEIYDSPSASNGINIVGIRNRTARANSFDDAIAVFWKDENTNKWEFRKYKATTDPGTHWLKNPMRSSGAAILKKGQYLGVYKVGLHGKNGDHPYVALEQAGELEVIRDNDKNNELDFTSTNTEKGTDFHINIHRSNPSTESTQVNKWSAGCQVFAKKKDWDEFIRLCQDKAGRHNQQFTYTLIGVEDIVNVVA